MKDQNRRKIFLLFDPSSVVQMYVSYIYIQLLLFINVYYSMTNQTWSNQNKNHKTKLLSLQLAVYLSDSYIICPPSQHN